MPKSCLLLKMLVFDCNIQMLIHNVISLITATLITRKKTIKDDKNIRIH